MQQKNYEKLILKISQEYREAHFAMIFTLIMTVVLAAFSFNFTDASWRLVPTILTGVYLLTTIFIYFLIRLIKRDLKEQDAIRKSTRILGSVLIATLLVGNIFAATLGFIMAAKNRSIEYTFAVYALFTQVFIVFITSFNLFKPYVTDTFFAAMISFALLIVFYLAMIIMSARNRNFYATNKWMTLFALIAVGATATGNLFSLLLGISILQRIYSTNLSSIEKWQNVWQKIVKNTMALFGLFFIILMLAVSITSVWTFDYDFAVENNYSALLQTPTLEYPLGTDNYGRDLYSRIIFGARISLIVGVISTLIPAIIGGFLGALSGYYGKATDNIIMRALDILYAIPGILLAIAIIAAFGANTVNLIIALSVGAIPTYARTMRANVMQIANYEFVESARALGASDASIIFKHIVPNSLAPMIVKSTLTIGGAVIATSSLSFLGLGIEPHIPEWGNILKIGSTYLETHSYVAIFPGLCIMLLVLSFNFLGDGLRDALDPKTN